MNKQNSNGLQEEVDEKYKKRENRKKQKMQSIY